MKKTLALLAFLGLFASQAFATDPCSKYTFTPAIAGCTLNGHALTAGLPAAYVEGDILVTPWPGCVPILEITGILDGYIFVPPNSWVRSHSIVTQLPDGCESYTYILHTTTINCSSAQPSVTLLHSYCPCQG